MEELSWSIRSVSHKPVRIVFAGGGTGGHVFPALAIADAVKGARPETEILFLGTSQKIEARVVPRSGYRFASIWIGGFQRGLRLRNVLFPLKVVVSVIQSFFHIRSFQPDVAVGTGGYVSGPVLWAASILGVPVVLHESNSTPGLATRLLARRARKVFTAFQETSSRLSRSDHVQVVGTPVRQSAGRVPKSKGLERFGLSAQKKTLLIIGGSLGAASINSAALEIIDRLTESGVQLLWQTGRYQDADIREALTGKEVGWVGPFINDMEYAYAAADLAVCRAGAATIAELTSTGTPAILVPYPRATDDHQTHNARLLEGASAAVVVPDDVLRSKLFPVVVDLLTNDERRGAMRAAALALARVDAAQVIAHAVLDIAE
jgi:UDP-N-acetylglucosamine--N-acetylmuramyl-(pentapeptide) pyrophosphoryl-undecaprenol N-acetylglucosamine transferase